ncbi:MAG: nitrate/nitrite transporter NrtS [Sulfitobacter sp.]
MAVVHHLHKLLITGTNSGHVGLRLFVSIAFPPRRPGAIGIGIDMSSNENMGFIAIATDVTVVKRAMRIALIVGTVLAVINQGDKLLAGQLDFGMAIRIILTYCVPYSVSTYSSYLAVKDNIQRTARQDNA